MKSKLQKTSLITEPIIKQLGAIVHDRLSTNQSVRDQHGKGESYHKGYPPDIVVFAKNNDEISQIVKLCNENRIPIIPFGAGTSVEGHVAALNGGVCIDISQMNEILQVNSDDLDCRVQAGVTRLQLNKYLHDTGLFFPVDPGADATLGGMVATRASGTNAVRYGTMRENVLGLTVVLADGQIIQTGSRARKSSNGYDLTRLFCGSEGTLGIITEVQLRLYGVPEIISSAVCSFPSLKDAVSTVIPVIQLGIPIARIELLDEVQMDAVNRYSKLEYPVRQTLFFEFNGTPKSVSEQIEMVANIAKENGGSDFKWADQHEERIKLWEARHNAHYAAKALRPGANIISTDVCVPISNLTQCILETKKDIEESRLLAPIVGHVGDGNFHVLFIIDPNDMDEMNRVTAVNDRMVRRALKMSGTCSGEHGIGYGKIKFMKEEHGEAVFTMQKIKRALDPNNIMNPGKILPASD